MYTRKVYLAVGALAILGLVASLNALALAGNANPEGEPLRNVCDFVDQAAIGAVNINLGGEAVIPVTVTSDGPVTGFRLEIQLPSGVAETMVQVERVGWPLNLVKNQDWWFVTGTPSSLVIADAGATLESPDNLVLLNIRINTHCWNTNSRTNNLVFILGSSPPGTPKSYLKHEDCIENILTGITSGYFVFNWIHVTFDVQDTAANLWEHVKVTVNCDNDYLFTSFSHRLYYNKSVLHYLGPEPTDRTTGHLTVVPNEVIGYLEISGSNPDGFGLSGEAGIAFYQIEFEVITQSDNGASAGFSMYSTQVKAIDCEQVLSSLYSFADVRHLGGTMTVRPLRVELDFGDVFSNKTNPCEFKVPVYLKNNCVVGSFKVVIGYDVGNSQLNFLRFEPDNVLVSYGTDIVCTTPPGTFLTLFTTSQGIRIPSSATYVHLGDLIFVDGTGSADVHNINVVASDCMYNNTFVETYSLSGVFFKQYLEPDPQTVFNPGTVTSLDPLAVKIYMPPANSLWYPPKHVHEWWATTTFWIKNTMDLSAMTFKITWNPSSVCVTQQGVGTYFPNATITVNEGVGEAVVTITNLPATPDSVRLGWIAFTNGRHQDNGFTPGVPDANIQITAVCPGQPLPTTVQKTIGLIFLKYVPDNLTTCSGELPYDTHPQIDKQAAVPLQFELSQNYPNPFNASTVIEFTVPDAAQTTLDVFNVMGQRVTTLLDAFTEAGQHSIIWNGHDAEGVPVASGMYFYRIVSGQHMETKKMVLMK